MADSFDPSSPDAMFARILAELDHDRKDRAAFRADQNTQLKEIRDELAEVRIQTTKTNGRVTKIETTDKVRLAKVAGVVLALGVAVWLFEHGWTLTHK